ncbi:MAG: hypothetical protein NVS2B8_09360 [Vulcanimicrobiaceae bacterium]
MKIACSSASFAHEIAAATMTQLEWLDVCANELEVDGVVFDTHHFPRTDAEYLAQLKKSTADLGLTVAALYARDAFAPEPTRAFELACALGAPFVVAPAAAGDVGLDAWGMFAAIASGRARDAKRANVTLAVRAVAGTVCATGADLRRLAKDVDSAWLRYTLDAASDDATEALRPKAVIAWHDVHRPTGFAEPGDAQARDLIRRLARFRGFVVVEAPPDDADRSAYHAAIERLTALRARTLATSVYERF